MEAQFNNNSSMMFRQLIHATLNANLVEDIGLFNGKMGYIILFFHYARSKECVFYNDLINILFEDIYQKINVRIPIEIERGLCGIGWGIEYLIQQNFIDGDSDEILKDIDNYVMERNPLYIRDFSFRTGLGGILLYVIIRLSSPRISKKLPFDDAYLHNLSSIIQIKQSDFNESLSCLSNAYLDVLSGNKKVKPCLLDLFNYAPQTTVYRGLEACWKFVDKFARVDFCFVEATLTDKTYYLINENSNSASYGIGTYLHQVGKALTQAGWQVTIITLRALDSVFSCIIEEGIRYVKIGNPERDINELGFKGYFERYYRNILILLRFIVPKNCHTIFHLNNMHMADLAMGLKAYYPKSKVVSTVHYMEWALMFLGNEDKLKYILSHPQEKEHKVTMVLLEENKRFLNACDSIITLSQHTYRTLTKICRISSRNILQIPLGIKDEKRMLDKKRREELRIRYGFRVDDVLLIWAGRVEPLKGVDLLSAAFINLLSEFPNLRLIIAGGGDLSPIHTLVKPHFGNITTTGYVDKLTLYELYKIADVGVLPSLYEEAGFVAIEMMMMGLPLIVGNNSGLEEIVEDGKSGWVVPFIQDYAQKTENIKALEDKIKQLLLCNTLRDKFAKNGRERFLKYYDISYFVENYITKIF